MKVNIGLVSCVERLCRSILVPFFGIYVREYPAVAAFSMSNAHISFTASQDVNPTRIIM